MRICTERWTKLAARGRFRFDAKARINNKDYTVISAPRIDRSLMPSPLSVGNCISATLNLSILTDDTITAKSPVVIMGRLTNDKTATEWKEFGTFYIDQRDTSFAGLVTIDCYDAMLKTNQNYLDGSDTAANWPKSMKSVVEEIAYRIGVGIDLRTRIKTGADYVVPYPSGKTMSQVLGYIGACHGGNWIITEENLLRLVPLTTAPDETFHVIDEDYNKITLANGAGNQPVRLAYKEQTVFNAVLPVPSGVLPGSSDNVQRSYFITDEKGNKIVTPEGYYLVWDTDANMAKKVSLQAGVINIPVVCGEITTGTQITVTGVTLNSDSGESYTAGNDNGTMLTIDSNPYATQGICNDLYAAFNGLVYLPFTATKSLYDPATELGDQVKIGELVHSVMFNVKLTLDHNFRADIEAPNSEELSEEYPYLSEVQHLKQTTEELNGAIQNAAKELAGKVDDTALAAEIERAQGVEVALSERIGNEETRAKGAEDGLSKRIKSMLGIMNATHQMNSQNTNVGGWASCGMRTWLNETIFAALPRQWQSMIKIVQVRSSIGDTKADISTSNDCLFLLSRAEVGFNVNDVPYKDEVDPDAENVTFALFTDNNSRIKKTYNGTGSASNWWLRSPEASGSSSFAGVNSNGGSSNNSASNSYGVAFGFCI